MINYYKNYLKLLVISSLTSSVIITYQIIPNWNSKNNNIIGINSVIAQPNSFQELDQSLSELDSSYNNFVSSLVTYLDELQQAIQQKRPANAVILNDTYEKLQILNLSQKKVTQSIQNLKVNIPKNISDTSQNLNVTIQNMFKILEPLKGGLEKENITQVQEFLDFFEKRSISPQYYGIYGSTTQEELEKFFAEKSRNLNSLINKLKEEINKERSQWQKNITPPQPQVNVEELYQEIEQLKAENAKLKEELSKYQQLKDSNFNWFLPLVYLLIIGTIITIVYQLIKQKYLESKTQAKPYNMTHNDILVIEEEIYELIAQEFKQQFKIFEERLNKLEKRSYQKAIASGITENAALEREISQVELLTEQPNIFNPYKELLNLYNQNPELLETKAIRVTEKQQESNTIGFNNIFFEKSNTGDYWIINLEENDYLVPQAGMIINHTNYSRINKLFECYGYKDKQNHSFKLLQPVKVSRNNSQEEWEFIQLGIIECKVNS